VEDTRRETPGSTGAFREGRASFRGTIGAEDEAVLPEVFECPQCNRQFVFELVDNTDDRSIHCPQCKRYLGEKDVNFVLLTEIDELSERLRFERDRLEKDEAVYAMTDCDAELKVYGTEVHKVVAVLRKTLADLEALKQQYR
jgi:transcription elongation factor Elf1